MMYPFLTLNDDTEITHSEMKEDGRVKVYIETPDLKDGFHNAVCWLPGYEWESINGYSEAEMDYYKQLIKNNAHVIIELSQEGKNKMPDKNQLDYTCGISDDELTRRFKESIRIDEEIRSVQGLPQARYDDELKKAYLEYPDGRRKYVG